MHDRQSVRLFVRAFYKRMELENKNSHALGWHQTPYHTFVDYMRVIQAEF